MERELNDLIDYYCKKNTSWNQSDLIDLLRDVQDEICGGVLKESVLCEICQELDIKRSYIDLVMKFVPDLKTEKIHHRMEICSGKNCQSNGSADLKCYIEKTYGVKKDSVSKKGSFSYKIGGCMKHCKNGPCIKWDGQVYEKMTPQKIDALIMGK